MTRRQLRRRRRTQAGYVALTIALCLPVLFLALAAISVDTARWYVEAERLQKAADAAALAGVVFMPQDFAQAKSTAEQVAARNAYSKSYTGVTINVQPGNRPSQLRVRVSAKIRNQFGSYIGSDWITISRVGMADYTGPAPMGSPCNTFGNEPAAGAGTNSPSPKGAGTSALPSPPFASCSSNPQFWANVEGPETGKTQGDRYGTVNCEDSANTVEFCTSHKNDEYKKEGYFFIVKVLPAAVGTPVNLQLYDPAFVNAGQQCNSGLPAASALDNSMNNYVTTDGKNRYGTGSGGTTPSFCPGDNWPGTGSGASPKHAVTTSFALRQQTDSLDPLSAPVQNDVSAQPCIKQYGTFSTSTTTFPTYDDLKFVSPSGGTKYNDALAKVFHNWVNFCTFTPTRSGDYYLQVRTDVKLGGTAETNTNSKPSLVYSGNTKVLAADGDTTTGEGSNGFAMRAVTNAGLQKSVAVAGYDRMPLYENGTSSVATFNLIQVLPGAAGQQVLYSFFDVAEASSSGTVKVLPPSDATGSIKSGSGISGCTSTFGANGTPTNLSGCQATVSSNNNGRLQSIVIPIPNDYNCHFKNADGTSDNGGCWFQVKVDFGSGSEVHDATTWDARIIGDPVRLVE